VILLWPLLLLGAFWVALESRERRASGEGAGCTGFWAWSAAGALMSFSLLTGFSIGLFVLPLAAAALLLAARRFPYIAESLGFLAGIGATLFLVAFIQATGDGSLSPGPWLIAGGVCASFAIAGYSSLRACSGIRP
jgi:hypothetical protein